ncbi:MAG: long-chain fatty acid--CoA ligase [Gammaproteobacteria bacterium]|nr:long-chain fatty acid--CoA ligase [Gammaproteobacteria bacterium]
MESVFDWLAYYAQFDPDRLAAVDLATRRWLTYREFNERATRLATALRERFGVEHGDRVGFLAHNSTDHFETMFACWKLGAVFVPINWRLSPHETSAIVEHCEPRVVLHDAELEPQLSQSLAPTVMRRPGDAACGYEQLIGAHQPHVLMEDVVFDTINMLLYTSGTTGRPKGVIYTHRMTLNIVLHAALHARVRAGTRTLTYSPLFHAAGLNAVAMPQFHYGGAVVVMKTFDPRECLRLLMDPGMQITHTVGVPTTYALMSQLPEFANATFPTLEVAGVGAAPVPLHLLEVWAEHGQVLSQSFGMTEAFSVSFTPPEKAREQIGSAGHPLMHVKVQIGDEQGSELPCGTVGEIQVRGPGVTPGYWHDPEATAAAFTKNAWFRTGDAGRMTEQGTIFVVDRIKDMYISGGENVYPAEIEDVIASLDEVAHCAVIGVPDVRWGEAGLALVVPRAGRTIEPERVLDLCRERLARYKVPRQVRVVEALPVSPQGKVLKKELRRNYVEAGGNPPSQVA